jgi:arsenate reductase
VATARSKLHWSIPDPAAVAGTEAEQRAAFEGAYADLEQRIRGFIDHAGTA